MHSNPFRTLQRKGAGVSNFKNIEKLGLNIWDYKDPHHHFAVDAKKLEEILQSAQVVYGYPEDPFFTGWNGMDKFPNKNPSHQALLICVEPYKKQTKAEAALEYIKRMAELGSEEAEEILEMKD